VLRVHKSLQGGHKAPLTWEARAGVLLVAAPVAVPKSARTEAHAQLGYVDWLGRSLPHQPRSVAPTATAAGAPAGPGSN
jgi:hypothetical protein